MTTSTLRDKSRKLPRPLRAVISLLFWFAVWEGTALAVGQELILPSPVSVARTLFSLGITADFWLATGTSLGRIFGGYLIGIAAGTLLAVLTSWSRLADTLISPAVRVMRAMPVASFIILALLWVGRARVPSFASMLMVIPIVWGNVGSAVAETDASLLEMAHAYRFGRLKTLRLVYAPSVFPSWRAGCFTSIGLAWKAGVAAEVLCQPSSSVGTELYYSKIYLETPSLFAWTAVVILLSFLLEKGFVFLLRGRDRKL